MRLHFNRKGLSSVTFRKGNMTYNTNGRVSYLVRTNRGNKNKCNNGELIADLAQANNKRMIRSKELIDTSSKAYIITRVIIGFLGLPIGIIIGLMLQMKTPTFSVILGGAITWWGLSIFAKMHDAKLLNKKEKRMKEMKRELERKLEENLK